MHWRFLDSGGLDGAEQMAIDAGLMDRARLTGESVFRVYRWSRPTLSFGRHESILGRFDPETLEREGIAAVRRPTGGRALMHDREVTYSVTAQATANERLRDGFRRINAILIEALARLGVAVAEAARSSRPRRPGGAACFAEPSAGELVAGGRKLVGSAQLRESGAILQHGSILIDDDQSRLATLAARPFASAVPAATLRTCLGRAPSYAEVRDALATALVQTEGEHTPLAADEAAAFAAPHRARFASAEWTWCR